MLKFLKERYSSYFNENLCSLKCYKAFTLAEVLIVLVIIGIIASITIPTLVNNAQKNQYVVALKKFYTTQASGWAQILADEGVQNLEDTSVFQSMGEEYCDLGINATDDTCKPFFDNLKKYFRFDVVTAPSYQIKTLDGSMVLRDYTGQNVLVFADGSIITDGRFLKAKSNGNTNPNTDQMIAAAGGHLYEAQAYNVTIDVNGFKKPNTYGRDVFEFAISSDGKLYPLGGKDWSGFVYWNLSGYWRNTPGPCGTPDSTDISGAMGDGCAARIMEEGWEMNY